MRSTQFETGAFPPNSRQEMRKGIRRIFSEVAGTYELVNHVLTLGLDILWRKKAAREAARADGLLWLDACSGTGEMALNLSRLAKNNVRVVAVDFCLPMLARLLKKKGRVSLFPVMAEAESLPFPDETVDLITISFATRNININKRILISHLLEFWRVLRPGGRFVNLETSQPSSKLTRRLFHFYVRTAVRPVGVFLSGSRSGYRYLSATIPRFYGPDEFSAIIREAGFSRVLCRRLFAGIAAIHTAWK